MTTRSDDLTHARQADDTSPFDHVQHPRRRAFLEALALTGSRTEAARAAGVHRTTPYGDAWKADADFQAALRLAEEISADRLVHEATRRAVEGVRRPVFDKRSGEPLRHPDCCDCGHDRREWHPQVRGKDGFHHGPCAHPECSCTTFEGAPTYEYEYSDRLLEQLLRARRPEDFGGRIQVTGVLTRLNMKLLPDVAVERIAAGENALTVLASIIAGGAPTEAEAVRAALPPGAEATIGRLGTSSGKSQGSRRVEIVQDGRLGDDLPSPLLDAEREGLDDQLGEES